jgi:hypothetical protein
MLNIFGSKEFWIGFTLFLLTLIWQIIMRVISWRRNKKFEKEKYAYLNKLIEAQKNIPGAMTIEEGIGSKEYKLLKQLEKEGEVIKLSERKFVLKGREPINDNLP